MDNVVVRLIDSLPCSVRAFTVVDENGDYNVYLNSKLSHEQLRRSYKHELQHIQNRDFDSQLPAHIIERCS